MLGPVVGVGVGVAVQAPGALPVTLGVGLLLLAGRACWVYGLLPSVRLGTVRRFVVTTVVLGLAAGGLLLVPLVNDLVLGDRPRDLDDFVRMCEGDGGADPFPRAAPYEPGRAGGPPPWVVVEEGWEDWSSTGGREQDLEDEPSPGDVQLVACAERDGRVPDTDISCGYTDGPLGLGPVTETVEFSQGRYRVTVYEARTGEPVGGGTLLGDAEVECADAVFGEDPGPEYTEPDGRQYADLLAEVHGTAAGAR